MARTDDGDALDDLERQLVAFVRAFGLHQPDVTPCGAPIPVSEAHALSELDVAGPLSQRELGERLGLAKGTVSRIVDLLVERGWARRIRSPEDGRVVHVRLTSAGRAAARRLAARRRTRLAGLLDHLPADERRRVIDALSLLTEAARADS
jgi:DNA-binding MarR family transcriptional regulator